MSVPRNWTKKPFRGLKLLPNYYIIERTVADSVLHIFCVYSFEGLDVWVL